MRNKIDICVVHYNTPLLMDALVKSISLHVPDYRLHIMDNSDDKPYVIKDRKIDIIDNTKGQIVDFDKWISQFPHRFESSAKLNNWGSAKHCYSVQKLIEIMRKPFILLDSDILLKKDISGLYDRDYVAIGDAGLSSKLWHPRLHPMLCFINPSMMESMGVRYFDEKRILGLCMQGDGYDTGGSFYEDIRSCGKVKFIKSSEYVIHYGSGSWIFESGRGDGKATHSEWLERYKAYWCDVTSKIERLKI